MATQSVGRLTQKLNLEINQGATFDVTLTWTDDETPPNINDLSGFTARMHIRATTDTAETLHELTTENGGIVLGDALGTIQLIISATDTADFTFSSSVYDLELVSASGAVTRLIQGSARLYKEVTR